MSKFSLTIDDRLLLLKSTSAPGGVAAIPPPPLPITILRPRLGLALALAFNELVEFDMIFFLEPAPPPPPSDEFDLSDDRADISSRLPRLNFDVEEAVPDDEVDFSFLLIPEPLLLIDWASSAMVVVVVRVVVFACPPNELIDCCFNGDDCLLVFALVFGLERVTLTIGAASADDGLILGKR